MLKENETIDYTELQLNKEQALNKMCTKETREAKALKRYFGFYLSTVVNEYGRLVKNQGKRVKQHFQEMAARNKELLSDSFSLIKLITFNI